jgi:hypothetical protein
VRFSIEGVTEEGSPHVWDDPLACVTLDRLLARADEAGHQLNLWDADLIGESRWIAEGRPTTRDQIKEVLELARCSAWTSAASMEASYRVADRAEAERALRIANTSLKVLVENRLRDGALLEAAVRLLGPQPLRDLWINSPSPPVVEVVHAGGIGDMPSFLKAESREARAANLPMRMIAVVDSDRDSANAAPDDKAQAAEAAAIQVGTDAFILCKRTGESYIPDFYWHSVMQGYHETRDTRTPIERLLAMSPEERDYCNMSKLKKQEKRDGGRLYHLQLLLQLVRDAGNDDSLLAEMADDLRRRDHTHDLTEILELIDLER